jgi:putative flavoprotein involved in K+ transport
MSAHDGQLVEEGAAFMELERAARAGQGRRERHDVVVIGGGQAGLAVGYHLQRQGLRFVILDAHPRVGDVWRRRWDSLRLFTPARLDGLPGMRFPASPDLFPTKDQMADYLEAYAARFQLPVRTGVKVDRLGRGDDGRFLVQAGTLSFDADQVVVAMASYQRPRLPGYATQLRPDVVQLHSSAYRNPGQLRDGHVLLGGAGNSGSEIAMELSRTRPGFTTFMSGRDTGHVPFRIESFFGRKVLGPLLLRIVFHRLLTLKTPMGRKIRRKVVSQGGPLIRVKPKQLLAAGVQRVGRVTGVRDGLPVLDDGRVLDVGNVIWCTGFHPGFSWIDLPVFDERGEPRHDGGVAGDAPGLYFVGLNFLYAMSSTMIHGVGRDAERIARAVGQRQRELHRDAEARRPEGVRASSAG